MLLNYYFIKIIFLNKECKNSFLHIPGILKFEIYFIFPFYLHFDHKIMQLLIKNKKI